MVLVLCLHPGCVDCQHCELSSNNQSQELNEKKDIPKYVVYSKNQDSDELKHVFDGFKR